MYFGDSLKYIWHNTFNLLQENIFVKLNEWKYSKKTYLSMQNLRKSGLFNSFWSQNSDLLLIVSLTIGGIRIWRCFLPPSQSQFWGFTVLLDIPHFTKTKYLSSCFLIGQNQIKWLFENSKENKVRFPHDSNLTFFPPLASWPQEASIL